MAFVSLSCYIPTRRETMEDVLRRAGIHDEWFATEKRRKWVREVLEHRDDMYCMRDIGSTPIAKWADKHDRQPVVEDVGDVGIFTDAALPKFVAFAGSIGGHLTLEACVHRWIEWADEALRCQPFPLQVPRPLEGSGSVVWQRVAEREGAPSSVQVVHCLVPCAGTALPIDQLAAVTAAALAADAPAGTAFLYHGTTHDGAACILRRGICVDLCRGMYGTDFGRGFHLSFDLREALSWAANARNMGNVEPAVLVFGVPPERRLDGTDREVAILHSEDGVWGPYVAYNRHIEDRCRELRKVMERLYGQFRVIVGPQAQPGADGSFRHPVPRAHQQCVLRTGAEARLWFKNVRMSVFYGSVPPAR